MGATVCFWVCLTYSNVLTDTLDDTLAVVSDDLDWCERHLSAQDVHVMGKSRKQAFPSHLNSRGIKREITSLALGGSNS